MAPIDSRLLICRAGSPDPAKWLLDGGDRRPRPTTNRSGVLYRLFVSAFVGGCLLFTACQKRDSSPDQILRLSQRNEPATLDPQIASLPDEFFIIRALSEGLVTPVPEGVAAPPAGVLPGAAVRWEMAPNGLQWTFHLRPEARWSNGDPVTAGDFVFTIRRALTPALAAPRALLFFALRNAEAFYHGTVTDFARVGAVARDDYTLVLTLEHPAPQLLALAASGPWLPVHAATVTQFGDSRESAWTRPGNFVGNGPFTLTEWRPHEVVVVTRNPRYHDAGRVHLGGIRFQAYDDENTEERAFRAGQVDVTMAVPTSRLASYAPPVRRIQPLAETRYLALNVGRPPLNDPRVRRALALALDRPELVQSVLKGGQEPAFTFIPPGLGGYQPMDRPAEDANGWSAASPTRSAPERSVKEDLSSGAAEARRLLAEAGFPGGRDFPRLETSTWTNTAVIEAVQQMWRAELGIETTIVRREAKVHVAALRAGDYAIGFLPAIPDYGDAGALFDELTSNAPGNYPHWRNARFDALVGEAAQTIRWPQRLSLYQKAEQILLAELPVIPLYFNAQNYLVAPRVTGWRPDRLWNRCYLDLSLHE
jgi:oligopeptide transport system substrate-binding protein